MKISIIPLIIFLFFAGCHPNKTNKAFAGISKLPPFTIVALDSSRMLKSEDIKPGKPCVFFYFDPGCEHCQKETEEIKSHAEDLKDVAIYFISNDNPRKIAQFKDYYHLESMKNITVGLDYNYTFMNVFLPSAIPYLAVYNHRLELTGVFKSSPKIEDLIAITRN